MGVSKYRGTPKWMVYFMENPMNKWMIWGVLPLFLECHPYNNRFLAHLLWICFDLFGFDRDTKAEAFGEQQLETLPQGLWCLRFERCLRIGIHSIVVSGSPKRWDR